MKHGVELSSVRRAVSGEWGGGSGGGEGFGLRVMGWMGVGLVLVGLGMGVGRTAPAYTVEAVGKVGFDVLVDGQRVAPVRLSSNGALVAERVEVTPSGLRLSGLRAKDPLAVGFGADDFVSIEVAPPGGDPGAGIWPEPVVRFRLTVARFDEARWRGMFAGGTAPFHFLVCELSGAEVWHQRGWLNATPKADPFPLLQDVHVGAPEISCLWNRNWSYLCPLGAHPIPMIGLWDPGARLYVGYDFQGARAGEQSERYVATAYCWEQGEAKNFITLAFPYGGLRYGELVYPKGGEEVSSWFHLVLDRDLPSTEDPNERFQARLFERYGEALPRVPRGTDMGWVPGSARRSDFAGPIGMDLFGPGGETTFYPAGTVLVHGWTGHREMPVDTAVRRGDLTSVEAARGRVEILLANHARTVTIGGERCLFWTKPLQGSWHADWGGAGVTTLHNADGWYPARVLVELYRYDRSRGQVRTNYLEAIDGLFNWAKHFVWTRNEFADVPSSPFAIGGTLSAAFLLDYYFTFRVDPQRRENAELARRLAGRLTWRYLPMWAMDSDRFDGALDSAFLVEPNSGRDWAGLACANEVAWNVDALTQVYVHTGDPRMRYYLRGLLQRWPALYRDVIKDSLAEYGPDAVTEGLGLFDGSGPGRGLRYAYGFSESFPLNEPVGSSSLRVVAGVEACIAFEKQGQGTDVVDYRTTGNGPCSFRVVSPRTNAFDLSFSYPFVDISRASVTLVRGGQTNVLGAGQVVRPAQSPSSLMIRQVRDGDEIMVGTVPPERPVIPLVTPFEFGEGAGEGKALGDYVVLPVRGTQELVQDWNDLGSFAGILPGLRWLYGVPYWQGWRAVTGTVSLEAAGTYAMVVAYAPSGDGASGEGPVVGLDDGSVVKLSGKPALAWRGWPPIFSRKILMDYTVVPEGRTVRQVDPHGHWLMAATAFRGGAAAWQPVEVALRAAGEAWAIEEAQRRALLALKEDYATLPAGRVALLPRATGGAGATFAAITGLRKLWVGLSEAQLVDSNYFTATRFPLAFYLGSERYVKTVNQAGDGKEAIRRYLAGGGTLVVLATGPFPFYYGDGPGSQQGVADPLLPPLGVPIQNAFEQAPAGLRIQPYPTQMILPSIPNAMPWPPGDPRLRSIQRAALNPVHRYTPVLRVTDGQGRDYGDAAGYLELRAGSASGGKVLYVWSTLLEGPSGNTIMGDAVSWLLNALVRSPRVNSIRVPSPGQAVVEFRAWPSVGYGVEYRDRFGAGAWQIMQEVVRSPTNRWWQWTNSTGAAGRFYRLLALP